MRRRQLTEKGRRLASQRDDLITQGADPADLLVPLARPDPGQPESKGWDGVVYVLAVLAGVMAIVVLAALSGCSTSDPPPDPYQVYLEHAPAGEPTLSRDDAQTRALLGCGEEWAPDTVDAILADAYEPEC